MFKKLIEFSKKLIYIIKIAKKPSFGEVKKLFYFIMLLTFVIGILSFLFYVIGLLIIQ